MADVSKQEYRERRRKEVHERLVAQTKKKGFMTPERKKRLRDLLRNNAKMQVQLEMAKKSEERKRIIAQRIGQPKPVANGDESSLAAICKEYHSRIYNLNEDKWDLELATNLKELEINELKEHVNDLRGKFIVPPLKKVSKYQTQLEKMRQWTYKLAKMDMRGALKPVKKDIELDEKLPKKENKPEWASPSTKPTTPTTPSPYKTASLMDLSNNKQKTEDGDEEEEESEEEEEDDVDMGEEVEEVELRMAA